MMPAVASMRTWPTIGSSFSKKMVGNLKCFLSLPPPQPYWRSSASLSSIRNASSTTSSSATTSPDASPSPPPLSGLEAEDDVMMGYVFGKKKATQVAHSSAVEACRPKRWRPCLCNGHSESCFGGYFTIIGSISYSRSDTSAGQAQPFTFALNSLECNLTVEYQKENMLNCS